MLYAPCGPDAQGDRVRLFFTDAAAIAASPWHAAWPVSVEYGVVSRRIVPTWTDPWAFDTDWWAPAYDLCDGSIMARAPIPAPLWQAPRCP